MFYYFFNRFSYDSRICLFSRPLEDPYWLVSISPFHNSSNYVNYNTHINIYGATFIVQQSCKLKDRISMNYLLLQKKHYLENLLILFSCHKYSIAYIGIFVLPLLFRLLFDFHPTFFLCLFGDGGWSMLDRQPNLTKLLGLVVHTTTSKS